MRSTFLLLFALFCIGQQTLFAAAQPKRVKPTTKEVVVYRSGARLTSIARVSVPAGRSEVVFEQISPNFNQQSLQVRLTGGVSLHAAVFQMRSPEPVPENPRIQVLRDSIVLLGDAAQLLQLNTDVYAHEEQMISQKIQQVATTTGTSQVHLDVAQLRELADLYRQRMLELKKIKHEIGISLRKNQVQVNKLQQTLQALYPNHAANASGEIVVKVESPTAQTIDISCVYLVYGASWSPLYDLRSNGFEQPLQITYKANVVNNTGFGWEDVKLALSTATPLTNNNRPIMNPVFVDFRVVQPIVANRGAYSAENLANSYQLMSVPSASNDANAEPYQPINVAVENPSEFVTNFELAKPQDIPADGQPVTVSIEEREMPAFYQYHAVPKLDQGVFLLAKIVDYGRYNLLPGTANIFFKETYVGQTTVNPNVTSDTLLISLGRDEQITIKRTQPKDFTEKRRKIINAFVEETYEYEISVRNNKAIPIEIEVLDQIPVSKQEKIEVELLKKDKAEFTADYGKLLWRMNIKAGKSETVRFSYRIKYPKDTNIGLGN
jgi:uncharacterized protein (TIGR02231 family)